MDSVLMVVFHKFQHCKLTWCKYQFSKSAFQFMVSSFVVRQKVDLRRTFYFDIRESPQRDQDF